MASDAQELQTGVDGVSFSAKGLDIKEKPAIETHQE